jgi:hypothetical protein
MSHTGGLSNLALLPVRAGFSGVRERLAKAPYNHTATQLHSHRSSVSDTLPLSRFRLDVRGLLVWYT